MRHQPVQLYLSQKVPVSIQDLCAGVEVSSCVFSRCSCNHLKSSQLPTFCSHKVMEGQLMCYQFVQLYTSKKMPVGLTISVLEVRSAHALLACTSVTITDRLHVIVAVFGCICRCWGTVGHEKGCVWPYTNKIIQLTTRQWLFISTITQLTT